MSNNYIIPDQKISLNKSNMDKLFAEIEKESRAMIDELIAKGKETLSEINWSIPEQDINGFHEIDSENIYVGTAGILLMFMEAFRALKDPRYLEIINKGSNWLIRYAEENPTTNFAFFTGRMGVSYTLLQSYQITQNPLYLKKAFSISANCTAFLTATNRPINELINGTAGTLLGLLHLCATEFRKDVFDNIIIFIKHLIATANLNDKGVYWDRSSKVIRGLCGFSHGSSGVGWVLLEAANFLKNKPLANFSIQAFHYENAFYNTKEQNWPDFRKGIFSEKDAVRHNRAFEAGDIDFFENPHYMSAWCHGAPGIGLSRMAAKGINHREFFEKDIANALKATKATLYLKENRYKSYTLCHGLGGNAMLFLEAYRRNKKKVLLAEPLKIAQEILADRKNHKILKGGHTSIEGEETGLFTGNAGIIYFLLAVRFPELYQSVLIPTVNYTDLPISYDIIDQKYIIETLFKATFPLANTYTLIEPEFIGFDLSKKQLLKRMVGKLKDLSKQNSALRQLLRFDLQIQKMDKEIKSLSYNYLKMENTKKFNTKLLNGHKTKLFETELTINPDLLFFKISLTDDHYVFAYADTDSVKIYPSNKFTYLLLRHFKTGAQVGAVSKLINTKYGVPESIVIQQIEEFLKAAFLTDSMFLSTVNN